MVIAAGSLLVYPGRLADGIGLVLTIAMAAMQQLRES